jgi:hyperosmotically inducible periplasmic protein
LLVKENLMISRLTSWFAVFLLVGSFVACGKTDAGITTSVKSKMAADDTVKAYQIDVDTKNKVVTLTGMVDTEAAKIRAVEIARGTNGVANVVDNVTVRIAAVPPPEPSDAQRAMLSDPALTTAVKAKLIEDTTVGGLRIDVDTNNGVVTLTGDVHSQAEKNKAIQLARDTDGVKSVTDKLTVKP